MEQNINRTLVLGLKEADRSYLRATLLNCLELGLMIALLLAASIAAAQAKTVRIKDIVDFEGVRDNQLVGYGLVVGLNGTGDSLNNSPFTEQSLISMLERLGVNIRGKNLNTGNVAAVMVTSTLPPFTNQGAKIDVNISALGDAKSLQGGTLLVTPLMAADGEVYAVAQGSVNISGFSVEGESATVTQNIPTAGRIPSGAIVERKSTSGWKTCRISAWPCAIRILQRRGASHRPSTVLLRPKLQRRKLLQRRFKAAPANYNGNIVDLITDIEQLPVQPDQIARVVIDERSGIIVMGSDVKISTVAIAQANLTVKITETPQVSQPNPFAEQGQTVVVPRTDIEVNSGPNAKLAVAETGVTLQDLVTGLNRLGVSPRDVITILQAIKAAGALQADIETL